MSGAYGQECREQAYGREHVSKMVDKNSGIWSLHPRRSSVGPVITLRQQLSQLRSPTSRAMSAMFSIDGQGRKMSCVSGEGEENMFSVNCQGEEKYLVFIVSMRIKRPVGQWPAREKQKPGIGG